VKIAEVVDNIDKTATFFLNQYYAIR